MQSNLSIYNVNENEKQIKHRLVIFKNKNNKSKKIPLYEEKPYEQGLLKGYICQNFYINNKNDDDTNGILQIPSEKGNELLYMVHNKSIEGKEIGYLDCGNDSYIKVYKKKNYVLPIIIMIILFLLLSYCILNFDIIEENITKPEKKPIFENTVNYTTEKNTDKDEKETGGIEIDGYFNLHTSDDKQYIYLNNPKTNRVYFTYEIYDTNTDKIILPETGLIEAGKAYPWKAGDYLKKGDYNIYFLIRTYNKETFTPNSSCYSKNINLSIN